MGQLQKQRQRERNAIHRWCASAGSDSSRLVGVERMNAADRLIGKAHDYEVLAAYHSEREALVGGGEHLAAATAFTVAALVMREVAAALEDEWEAA